MRHRNRRIPYDLCDDDPDKGMIPSICLVLSLPIIILVLIGMVCALLGY